MKRDHLIPLSPKALEIIKKIHSYSGICENVFPKHGDPHGFISENTLNNSLKAMGYDTQSEVCLHGFRGMACGALAESLLFTEEAVEKQMSHKETNQVRLAYTHHVEFLEERKRMMHWWSDYIENNRNDYISPTEFAKKFTEKTDTK